MIEQLDTAIEWIARHPEAVLMAIVLIVTVATLIRGLLTAVKAKRELAALLARYAGRKQERDDPFGRTIEDPGRGWRVEDPGRGWRIGEAYHTIVDGATGRSRLSPFGEPDGAIVTPEDIIKIPLVTAHAGTTTQDAVIVGRRGR